MKSCSILVLILNWVFLGTMLLVSLDGRSASAAPCVGGAAVCGQNSGLVPFHKDAIGATLLWEKKTEKSDCPKMLIWMRPAEYKPKDYLNPTVGGVFSGFNPHYLALVQGGIALGNLDQSGWSRYSPDLERENVQLIDVCGLQALIDSGIFTKTNIVDLTDDDIRLTDPFFEDAGYSKGLGYNIFCMGNVAGVDGRIYVQGIHDKRGNNGGRKNNIFNPQKAKWVSRPITCVRSEFAADPTGTSPHCSALDENNTDPLDPSDMKYARWYPTSVTLPDGRILILSGSNTEEVPPPLEQWEQWAQQWMPCPVPPREPGPVIVRQPVPEVYDPKTDRIIALENARKCLPMFPRAHVVQTGAGKNDWKVCSLGEVVSRPEGAYDPFLYDGKTYCLDVLAALADPDRDVPAEKHWTFVDTAANAHDSGASVRRVTINWDGTWSQELWAFGGSDNQGPTVATVEKINFAAASPKWETQTPLIQATTQNNAVALPTGDMFVVGGRGSLQYQLFHPDGTRTDLISSTVPRHDHATALYTKNAVWIMGGNRTDLLPAAQRNLAVPVLEAYKPPYLYWGPQPVLKEAPHQIHYRGIFELKVSGEDVDTEEIGAVALLRTGPITHNWAWGNQYVQLPFKEKPDRKHKKESTLEVKAPHLPGLAIAGDYLLFVVNKKGIPSEGTHIRLRLDD
jgi:Domain of unknown function (DUF1929)